MGFLVEWSGSDWAYRGPSSDRELLSSWIWAHHWTWCVGNWLTSWCVSFFPTGQCCVGNSNCMVCWSFGSQRFWCIETNGSCCCSACICLAGHNCYCNVRMARDCFSSGFLGIHLSCYDSCKESIPSSGNRTRFVYRSDARTARTIHFAHTSGRCSVSVVGDTATHLSTRCSIGNLCHCYRIRGLASS